MYLTSPDVQVYVFERPDPRKCLAQAPHFKDCFVCQGLLTDGSQDPLQNLEKAQPFEFAEDRFGFRNSFVCRASPDGIREPNQIESPR